MDYHNVGVLPIKPRISCWFLDPFPPGLPDRLLAFRRCGFSRPRWRDGISLAKKRKRSIESARFCAIIIVYNSTTPGNSQKPWSTGHFNSAASSLVYCTSAKGPALAPSREGEFWRFSANFSCRVFHHCGKQCKVECLASRIQKLQLLKESRDQTDPPFAQ